MHVLVVGWHSGGQDWPSGNHGNCLAVLGRFITWHFVRLHKVHWWVVLLTGHIHCVNRLEVSKLVPASISVLKRSPTDSYLPADTSGSVSKSPLPVFSCTFQPSVFTLIFRSNEFMLVAFKKVGFPFPLSSIVFLDIFPIGFQSSCFGYSLLL